MVGETDDKPKFMDTSTFIFQKDNRLDFHLKTRDTYNRHIN